jgi:hypothetical protein
MSRNTPWIFVAVASPNASKQKPGRKNKQAEWGCHHVASGAPLGLLSFYAVLYVRAITAPIMTVLTVGRFAEWGVGNVPKRSNWKCGHVPKISKGYGPELSSHVESGELAEGERPGAHVAGAKAHAILYTV